MGVLDEAKKVCYGDRLEAYGHPYTFAKRTIEAFNALTGHELSVEDCSTFLLCVKLARREESPDRQDTYIDLAGYADVAWRVHVEHRRRCRADSGASERVEFRGGDGGAGEATDSHNSDSDRDSGESAEESDGARG